MHIIPTNGGELAIRTLERLGATHAVGLPGQHALALFDALGRSTLRYLGARTEQAAGTMADGMARALGAPVPLLLSAGPGALGVLPAVQEARDASSPVIVIAAGIPTLGQGGSRKGLLHELDDQTGHYAGLVKGAWRVRSVWQIPGAIAAAWQRAAQAPFGPVVVELPSDVLEATTGGHAAQPDQHAPAPKRGAEPEPAAVALAARLLAKARHPAIYAGGGVVRAGAGDALVSLAEALGAAVVTTPAGRAAMSMGHPLCAGGWIEDVATMRVLEDADVLLAVGTGLGELTTNYRTMAPRGSLIHVDADELRIGANYPTTLGIPADALPTLERLDCEVRALLGDRAGSRERHDDGRGRARAALDEVIARLDAQPLATERALLAAIRDGVPDDVATYWDMTIMAYWAWSAWDARGGAYENAQSGELGFGYSAALGAAHATGERVIAVSGDGGAAYALQELATAAQHRLPVTWIVIDDGGYGILSEYMTGAFGRATATNLAEPNFVAIAEASGVRAQTVPVGDLAEAIRVSCLGDGPELIHVPAHPAMFAPTHLDTGKDATA